MRRIYREKLAALEVTTGLPTDAPDPAAATAPLVPIPTQLQLIIGQSLPNTPAGQQWPMSNNALYYFTRALDARLTQAEQVAALQLVSIGATDSQVTLLRARLELVRAAGLATQSQLDANAAADAQAVLRLAAVEKQQAADKLADVARDQHEAAQDAQLALLAARATQDEAAIATAQAAASAAWARAEQAIANAAAAQATATGASTAAATAQATAAAAQAAAAANTASLATVAADVATRLPAAAVQRFVVNVPAVTIQVLTPYTQVVTLPKEFPSANYLVFLQKASNGLLNTELGDSAKTARTFLLSARNTGAVSLAMPAGVVEVLAILL